MKEITEKILSEKSFCCLLKEIIRGRNQQHVSGAYDMKIINFFSKTFVISLGAILDFFSGNLLTDILPGRIVQVDHSSVFVYSLPEKK